MPRTKPSRGSHLPVLMRLFAITDGPILELGSGMYSTPYLHWATFSAKRRLITYEDNPDWIEFVKQFATNHHEIHIVTDWDAEQFPEASIALVDHDPKNGRLRSKDAARLAHCDYVVCHDSDNCWDHKYRYSSLSFKHRLKYAEAGSPHTTIYSNKFDLRNL